MGHSNNLDSCLTERGWSQAHTLGRHVRSQHPTSGVQLVVVSPLIRALETAAGVFGEEPSKAEAAEGGEPPAPLLMAGQEGERNVRTAHGAVALPPGVKFLAVELCRERLGGCPCLARWRPVLPQGHQPTMPLCLIASVGGPGWAAPCVLQLPQSPSAFSPLPGGPIW